MTTMTEVLEKSEQFLIDLELKPKFLAADDNEVAYEVEVAPLKFEAKLEAIGAVRNRKDILDNGAKARTYTIPDVGTIYIEYARFARTIKVVLRRLQAIVVSITELTSKQLQLCGQSIQLKGADIEQALVTKKLHAARRKMLINEIIKHGGTAADVSNPDNPVLILA